MMAGDAMAMTPNELLRRTMTGNEANSLAELRAEVVGLRDTVKRLQEDRYRCQCSACADIRSRNGR